jgi:hypothetical protein
MYIRMIETMHAISGRRKKFRSSHIFLKFHGFPRNLPNNGYCYLKSTYHNTWPYCPRPCGSQEIPSLRTNGFISSQLIPTWGVILATIDVFLFTRRIRPLCDTPHQTHFVMVLTVLWCGPSCGLWLSVELCAKKTSCRNTTTVNLDLTT